ncbi:hypothetical protein OCU04_013054 [Sclerotinia nivalis]|uniref:NmrA-like domain-containing protein n=1 Tax=Sclerotinia nivalis TaxID=352851 RepID=A0A9X0DCW6_9HELO|nr:hypothetical protein OCU04_013054 [Sclerotinia nivalis]
MAPTILIVGATGNTGRSVVKTLSKLLTTSNALTGHHILALTRSSENAAAQQLAKLPGVSVKEHHFAEISPEWLRQNEVVRAFIAPHTQPNNFIEESSFHLACLKAGVEYVVRISTTAANVRPDCDAYYPRTHWAIEALLSSPEFEKLRWSSLQPNVFTPTYLAPALEFIKHYRKTGEQSTLSMMGSEDAPVGVVHPDDVGRFAAILLSSEDTSVHSNRKYVLNGPEDITGRQVMQLVEQAIDAKVKNVKFKNMDFIDDWAKATSESKYVISSIKYAPVTSWEGKCTISTTSKEVLELAPPKITCDAWLKNALEE